MSMTSLHATAHHIRDPFEWPLPAKKIAQTLGQPLPSYLATGPYPFVSDRAFSLLQELASSSPLRVIPEDSRISDERPLMDVFDIVLSTVSELRDLVKWKDYGCPRSTALLWSTLIKALGHTCSNDVSVMGNVSFILPRVAPSEQRKREKLDGTATMLLSYVVDSIDRHEAQSLTSSMDVDRKSSSDESEANEEDINISENYIKQSSSEASSTLSINVPFDAHVLPGHGRRYCAILPLLCVADEENVIALLSSVLYQRRVWGIDEPAVGVVFSKTGTVGRVVLGWLDLECTNDCNLPNVHIACAITDISDASLGVFDLTEPASTFALAQFILDLNTHFNTIIRAASNPEMHTLDWRSDHITIDGQKIDGEQWRRSVAQWACAVEVCDGTCDDSSNSSEETSLPRTPSPHELPLRLPVSTSTSMPSGKPPGTKKPKDKTPDATVAKSEKSSARPPTVSDNHSTFSSSSFGKRSAAGLGKTVSISTWLFERRALTIALIELEGDTVVITDINSKIKLYHEMTRLLWPAEWLTVNALPQVDGGVEQVRQHLFLQYKEVRKASVQSSNETSENDQDALKPAHVDIFSQRLSTLLWATIGAFTLKAATQTREVYEAEARHDWDAVLYRFCASPGQLVSPKILLERTLRFPRNGTADGTDSSQVIEAQRALAEDYSLHCSNAQFVAHRRRRDKLVRDQTFAAMAQAAAFGDDLASFDPLNFLDMVKRRAAPEPRTGKCDAVLVTPVSMGTGQSPGEPQTEEYLKAFSLMKAGEFTHPKDVAAKKSDVAPSDSSSHLSVPSPKPLSREQKKLLRNPLYVSCTESTVASPVPIPEDLPLFDSSEMILSGFVVEYKKRSDDEAKALNQERMYLVALVTHLATLGIKGFAVFGLITSGQTGGIMMAWQSEVEDKMYIIERNIRTFNLSSPIEAFQFASFLIRLREHTDTLKDLFEKKKEEFLKKAERGELPKWTKDAQGE